MYDIIILAPHVDDEVIGLYESVLTADNNKSKSKLVMYFFDLTPERYLEGRRSGNALGYDVLAYNLEHLSGLDLSKSVIYIPSPYDLHPHHRATYSTGIQLQCLNKFFYSVDMNRSPTPILNPKSKKDYLLEYFPSQSTLVNRDDKYHLFEDVFLNPFNKKVTQTIEVKNDLYNSYMVSVTLYGDISSHVSRVLSQIQGDIPFNVIANDIWNSLSVDCPGNDLTITITQNNFTTTYEYKT